MGRRVMKGVPLLQTGGAKRRGKGAIKPQRWMILIRWRYWALGCVAAEFIVLDKMVDARMPVPNWTGILVFNHSDRLCTGSKMSDL